MTQAENTADDYVIGVCDDPGKVDAAEWDALLASQPAPTPFLKHAYLAALHRSASAVPATGWNPAFLTLRGRDGALHGAVALYLKTHSSGEYVFDWAWADAYRRHGLRYYPKLLGAVPFTPVPGTRLLARDEPSRALLAQAVIAFADGQALSSAHLLFVDETDRTALEAAGWSMREGVQFHWTRDAQAPAGSFEEMTSRMQRHKRKNIAQERRRVGEAGVSFTVHEGEAIDTGLWDFFHACYTLTYEAHGSTPYLTRAFFADMAGTMAPHWLMFVAWRDGRRIAASLVAIDRDTKTAWGRYWGATEHVPCLHFEACYYQPLAWCIAEGFERFEGGAQGEHKMARGLLPVRTSSAHWLRDSRFADAVADFLAREGSGIEAYVDELRERNPFRTVTS